MIRSPLYYTGDKYKILDQILPHVPKGAKFFDLFMGGGSILANISNSNVIANDINAHVVGLVEYLKTNSSKDVISNLKRVAKKYKLSISAFEKYETKGDKKFYSNINRAGHARLREDYNLNPNIDLLFPLVLYSYNRLLRFNLSGKYNVPVGTLDVNKNVIKHVEQYTKSIKDKKIKFMSKDFREVIKMASKGDVVFVDPPYIVSNAEYNGLWSSDDERDLYEELELAITKGAKILLTNYASRGTIKNKAFTNFYKGKKKISLKSFHYSFHNNSGNESIEYLVIGGNDV